MFIEQFVKVTDGQLTYCAEQASRFAKQIAEDFNPIHDPDSKRFCVPGDLLFATLISQLGVSQSLHCRFEGMVSGGTSLTIQQQGQDVSLVDSQQKSYLSAQCHGEVNRDPLFIEQLIRDYVRFSGQNFPHILQPLMQQHQLMINPARPLVIYQSMSLQFAEFTAQTPQLHLCQSEMTVDGKRGNVVLSFEFVVDGKVVGTGEKRMILSNLVAYDAEAMQGLVDLYNQRKSTLATAA